MAFLYYVVGLTLIASCYAGPASHAVASQPRSPECKERYGYYRYQDSCDAYVKCVDYVAYHERCPDGLHFNDKAEWGRYPCGYPMDVLCRSRAVQPPEPTAECPHQYGYFASPSARADNCGQYRQCVAGRAFERSCGTGLAFHPEIGACDWPDHVPSCNATAFLGFACPPAPVDDDGKPIDKVINYRYNGSCYYFFSCELNRARLLSCDQGFAFDEVSGRCVDMDLVDCKNGIIS